MNVPFAIIVAVDNQFGMGKNGVLPWRLPGELKHFKDVTTAVYTPYKNVVIMGRKTWGSIPEKYRPLPGRHNIVLTKNSNLVFPYGVFQSTSLDSALDLCVGGALKNNTGKLFVIGGAELFNSAIQHPSCREIYLTQISAAFACDCFFPAIPGEFRETERTIQYFENSTQYCFIKYQK